jgi:type I restriction enzyme S subunit
MPLGYAEAFFNATRLDFHVTGTAQPKLTQAALNRLTIPLPPLEEQIQIVEEVERRLSVVEQTGRQIARDIACAARLRQSILKRAFEGRLVPQDPRDEPASKLLARLAATGAAPPAKPISQRRRGKVKTHP